MAEDEAFSLIPTDGGWQSALLFETPEQIFRRVFRVVKPRSACPDLRVRFEKFAGASSTIRLESGHILVRISDLLEGAPAPVMESLAFILLCKLWKKSIPALHAHRYRLFLNRKDVRRRIMLAAGERGRKLHRGPRGAVHDLEVVFEKLNGEHFGGLMARPELGWSLQRSRTRLGHFDASHNAIMISGIFDRPDVPALALEYVMFHEMLHLRHPVEHRGARRCVHTPSFKAAEKDFPRLDEAKQILKNLPARR